MIHPGRASMTDLQRTSPLASALRSNGAAGFELHELAHVAKVRVQALRPRGMLTPCADPQRLPVEPNTALGVEPIVLWKGPDDWLAYSLELSAERVGAELRLVTSSAPLVLTDVSSASLVLELRGPRALDVLMRDCTLDLEQDAIEPGNCAQTLLAQVGVMIHRLQDADAWRLFVERSVAVHLWEWLMTSRVFP